MVDFGAVFGREQCKPRNVQGYIPESISRTFIFRTKKVSRTMFQVTSLRTFLEHFLPEYKGRQRKENKKKTKRKEQKQNERTEQKGT